MSAFFCYADCNKYVQTEDDQYVNKYGNTLYIDSTGFSIIPPLKTSEKLQYFGGTDLTLQVTLDGDSFTIKDRNKKACGTFDNSVVLCNGAETQFKWNEQPEGVDFNNFQTATVVNEKLVCEPPPPLPPSTTSLSTSARIFIGLELAVIIFSLLFNLFINKRQIKKRLKYDILIIMILLISFLLSLLLIYWYKNIGYKLLSILLFIILFALLYQLSYSVDVVVIGLIFMVIAIIISTILTIHDMDLVALIVVVVLFLILSKIVINKMVYIGFGIPWKNAIVPYVIRKEFTDDEKEKLIQTAFQEITEVSGGIKFVPRTNQKQFLTIYKIIPKLSLNKFIGGPPEAPAYTDGMGKQLFGANLYIDPTYKDALNKDALNILIHELMHVLGFMHEHQRPDRDSYIEFNLNNGAGVTNNVKIKNIIWYDVVQYFDYDYVSLMHYPPNNESMQSIIAGKILGGTVLTETDKEKLRKYYQVYK